MAGTQERLMVLKMLEEKRISAREAEELLAALDRVGATPKAEEPRPQNGEGRENPRSEPDFDFGDFGRGVRDAVRRFTDGIGKLAEGVTRGEDIGAWFRENLGTARVTVEKEIRVPAGIDQGTPRIVYAGSSGDVAVRGAEGTEIWGTAFLTVWGPDELTARQSAEELQVRVDRKGDVLDISIRPGLTEQWGGTKRPGRWECRVDLTVPRSASLRLSTASGDISAAGIGGDSSLSTASGDVSLRSPSGSVKVQTASGDVVVRLSPESRVRLEAATANGEITVRAPLQVERFTRTHLVGSLNAGGSAPPVGSVGVGTASGDILIETEPR